MFRPKTIVLAVILSVLATAPGLAQPVDKNPNWPGNGWGPGGKVSIGMPAPIAGAGIPFVIVAGAYLWLRRRRHH